MANPIVIVNVSQTIAPTPSVLQRTGALISMGETTMAAQNYALLTQADDLTSLRPASLALTTVVWAATFGGQVTATTAAPHGVATGTFFTAEIAGVVPAEYNGTYRAQATGASTFTYYLAADPGAQTTAGTWTKAELASMVNTFFAQGAQQPVYVLELGNVSISAAVDALEEFIETSQQFFYSYLVPREWAYNADFITFLSGFESTTSKTYFFTTVNLENKDLFDSDQLKDVIPLTEAPVYGAWASVAVSTSSWAAGEATVTTASPHGVKPGDTFTLTGIDPTGYNGTYVARTGTTGSTLIYRKTSNSGAYVSGGTLLASRYASAGPPATEFSHASDHWVSLSYNPSTTNKVPPFSFSFLQGVTRFPTQGNSVLISSLAADDISYVGFGGEGGISDNILRNGHTLDGRPFNYWYATDWMQINVQLAIANEIINGSNDRINPLYYNQDGINRLQQRAASVGGSAITFGLALGKVIQTSLDGAAFSDELNAGRFAGQLVINAVPFVDYTRANPSHYKLGQYDGLSMVFTPLRGFEHIVFNINVTDFVSA